MSTVAWQLSTVGNRMLKLNRVHIGNIFVKLYPVVRKGILFPMVILILLLKLNPLAFAKARYQFQPIGNKSCIIQRHAASHNHCNDNPLLLRLRAAASGSERLRVVMRGCARLRAVATTNCARLRAIASGCERLRAVARDCERL